MKNPSEAGEGRTGHSQALLVWIELEKEPVAGKLLNDWVPSSVESYLIKPAALIAVHIM